MAQVAIQHEITANTRTRTLVFPREHGAWGILLVPLLTGAAVGASRGSDWSGLAMLAVLTLSLFWLRTPLESCLGTSPMRAHSSAEVNAVLLAIAALGSVAMLSAAALLWHGQHRTLLAIGMIVALALAGQALLKRMGRRGRMPAQIVGAIGLTATAPSAYYVMTGKFGIEAIALWAANWIFAGNQIHYVQLRIHAARAVSGTEKLARGRWFLAGEFAMAAALVAIWRLGVLPGLALLAFAPVLARGSWWFFPGHRPLAVRRLGWTELAHNLAFGALLIVGFVR